MVTEKDVGKIVYKFSWHDGSVEKGVLKGRHFRYGTQFFIITQEENGLFNLHYAFNNQTFVKKREFMSFLKKYSHCDKKTKNEFVYFGSHGGIMLKDLFRKIKDL